MVSSSYTEYFVANSTIDLDMISSALLTISSTIKIDLIDLALYFERLFLDPSIEITTEVFVIHPPINPIR